MQPCSCGGSQQGLVPTVSVGWRFWVQLKKEEALGRPHHTPVQHPSLHATPRDVAQTQARSGRREITLTFLLKPPNHLYLHFSSPHSLLSVVGAITVHVIQGQPMSCRSRRDLQSDRAMPGELQPLPVAAGALVRQKKKPHLMKCCACSAAPSFATPARTMIAVVVMC